MPGADPSFDRVLVDLGIVRRRDSARTIGRVAEALSSRNPGRFGLTELGAEAPGGPINPRALRWVLRKSSSNAKIFRTLCTAIPFDDVWMLRLASEPTGPRRRPSEALGLEAIGQPGQVLVTAHRAEIGLDIPVARFLLDSYAKPCRAAGSRVPPLYVGDKTLAREERFRGGIVRVAPEYVMEVDESYLFHAGIRGPHPQRGLPDVYERTLAWPEDAALLRPEPFKSHGAPSGELACGWQDGDVRRAFVVRPQVTAQAGQWVSVLARKRALELVVLVSKLPRTPLSERFRIADFSLGPEDPWARGIRIRSLYDAYQEGLLT
jgi:hypothetical protein